MTTADRQALGDEADRPGTVRLWVGTYPPDGPEGPSGTGEGIWALDLDLSTGDLAGARAVEAPAPSFVAVSADGRTVYAVGETDPGTVSTFAVVPGGLSLLHRVGSGGAAPCHLLLDPAGRALYVTNYSSGTLGVLPLVPGGGFAPDVLAARGPVQVLGGGAPGAGVVPDRQESPHAHSSILAPGGHHLLVADLGTDELRRYEVLDDGLLADAGIACTLPPGTGPRHVADGPGGHLYVVGELSRTVLVLAWDPVTATARPLQVVPVAGGGPARTHRPLPAHVIASPDRVLVSVRGADVVSELSVLASGARLEPVQEVRVDAWPRHFAEVGPWLVVAAQDEGTVQVLRRSADGLVGVPGARFPVPFPACVVRG